MYTYIRVYIYMCIYICMYTYICIICICIVCVCLRVDRLSREGLHGTCHVFNHNAFRDTLQHTSTHCNTLQHTATHCNTLQHTATHCNTCHIFNHNAFREIEVQPIAFGVSFLHSQTSIDDLVL